MKRLLTAIIMSGFLFANAIVCAADDFTFRNTKWGMTMAEVKASESLDVTAEETNVLGYKTNVIGKDVLLGYIFVDDQLVRVRYMLAETHMNQNDYITDYKDFKEILEKKYGAPKEDDTVWKNDLYKDDPSGWGTAIAMGHLVYYSSWETQTTEIINVLMGDNFDVKCIVEYNSKELKHLLEKAKEKKALDAF